jgi:hypothetical protein
VVGNGLCKRGQKCVRNRKSLCRIPLYRAVSKQPLMLLSVLMEEKPHGAAVTNGAKFALCCLWNVLFCYIRCRLREVCGRRAWA